MIYRPFSQKYRIKCTRYRKTKDARITVRTVAQVVEIVKKYKLNTSTKCRKFAQDHRFMPKTFSKETIQGWISWPEIWKLAGITKERKKRPDYEPREGFSNLC